jgi:heavy metal sensor kinase
MIRALPIRWRLSLWYMSLTALVLVIFSVAVYIGLERRLSATLDEDLRSQASLAASSVTFGGGNAILDAAYQLSNDALLWVLSLNGTQMLKVGGTQFEQFSPQQDEVERAAVGKTTLSTVKVGDQTLRMITVPIRGGDRRGSTNEIVGALQLGYSTSRVEDALDLLVQALLVIAPVAIVIAALTGYLLAGRALRPVADITRLAGQIDGDDLAARLSLDLPNDELGRLASTFDSMLGRIDLAFQRQRQFTGDAAHELRTPLALMRSQIDLALTQADTPLEFREALTALDGDVARMTSLVGMLLSLARADAGQLAPNRDSVDLADLARDVAEQLEPIARENGIAITTDLAPVTVSVDADMIIQVLVNLIDNAITNTPPGGTITVRVAPGDAATAVVAVSDTGVGIPPEHLPRIFDRFYRIDTGRARSRGGIGLGLAICQAIAHAHDGVLSAHSENGHGSTFTLTIPIET